MTEPFRFYGGPIDDPDDGPEGLINAWPMDEAYVDYVAGKPGAGIVNDRKGHPKITAAVIVEANEQGGEFRTAFLGDPDRALRRIMRGIGALAVGELAGERMAVAFESADQEDEHSCFSDNTNADVVNDIKGIRMVYEADFPGISGASLHDLLGERDAKLADRTRAEIDAVLAKAQAFPATFERMIAADEGSAERDAIEAVIEGLEDLGETFAKAAKQLDVKVGFRRAPADRRRARGRGLPRGRRAPSRCSRRGRASAPRPIARWRAGRARRSSTPPATRSRASSRSSRAASAARSPSATASSTATG